MKQEKNCAEGLFKDDGGDEKIHTRSFLYSKARPPAQTPPASQMHGKNAPFAQAVVLAGRTAIS